MTYNTAKECIYLFHLNLKNWDTKEISILGMENESSILYLSSIAYNHVFREKLPWIDADDRGYIFCLSHVIQNPEWNDIRKLNQATL